VRVGSGTLTVMNYLVFAGEKPSFHTKKSLGCRMY